MQRPTPSGSSNRSSSRTLRQTGDRSNRRNALSHASRPTSSAWSRASQLRWATESTSALDNCRTRDWCAASGRSGHASKASRIAPRWPTRPTISRGRRDCIVRVAQYSCPSQVRWTKMNGHLSAGCLARFRGCASNAIAGLDLVKPGNDCGQAVQYDRDAP